MCVVLFREAVSRVIQLRDARAVVKSPRTLNAIRGSFTMRNLFSFGNPMTESSIEIFTNSYLSIMAFYVIYI